MNYKIMFYVGMVLTIILLIITIIAFFRCNVVEIIYDLLGIKRKKKISKGKKDKKLNVNGVKVKKIDEVEIKSKADLQRKEATREYQMENSQDDDWEDDSGEFLDYISKSEKGQDPNYKKTELLNEDNTSSQAKYRKMKVLQEEGIARINTKDRPNLLEEDNTDPLQGATGILDEEMTGILDEEMTGILDEEMTGILDEEATGILDEEAIGLLEEDDNNGFSDVFTKEIDIKVIHTDKVI